MKRAAKWCPEVSGAIAVINAGSSSIKFSLFAEAGGELDLKAHGQIEGIYTAPRFVASPRHADVLLVTGPVTTNMREALERTYQATPGPKWVVAIGDCARDGGVFSGSYACVGGVSAVLPVDLHIRGCPPSPSALLRGLLALLETVQSNRQVGRVPAIDE